MGSSSNGNLRAALLCYAAFLLYATLWPFDFHFVPGFAAARKISWIPFFDPVEGPGRRDAVMNILVFLPFGALSFLVNSASAKIRRPVLIATLLGGALSLTAEIAQIWLPSRNPSTSDLLMNTTGALLGALSAGALQRKVHSDPEGIRLCIRRNAVPLAVIAYALALLASTMRTFDPILNWRVLGIRAGAFVGSPIFPDHLDLDYIAWMVLSFGFLAFLAAEWLTGTSLIRRRHFHYAGAFVTCSLFAVTLEALQILFRSRHPLLSHALLGIIGVGYGIAWHAVAARFRLAATPGPIQAESHESGKARISLVIPLFFIHYILFIFLAYLSPIPHTIGGFRFDIRGLIPLYFYLQDISLPSLYSAAKAIVLYIPMGIMAHWTPNPIRNQSWWILVIIFAGVQATIEICRGFSGYPYPDPSNIFLAALGCLCGLYLTKNIFPIFPIYYPLRFP